MFLHIPLVECFSGKIYEPLRFIKYISRVIDVLLKAAVQVLLSLVYNPSVISLVLYRRCGKEIHPGWHVGVDLFVWGLSLPAILFSIGDGWFFYWQPVVVDIDGLIPCDEFNFWSEECNPLIYTLGRMEIAANVFLALILIIHFILFVYACIATHKWRKMKGTKNVERRNIELQYNRKPEDHTQQRPPAYTPSVPRASEEDPVSPISTSEEAAVKYA